jgi:hypothetical protein
MLFRRFARLKYLIKNFFFVHTLWFIRTAKWEDAHERITGTDVELSALGHFQGLSLYLREMTINKNHGNFNYEMRSRDEELILGPPVGL